MGAVAVAQHLHAKVFRHNDVPRAIKRYGPGKVELPVVCSFAADGAQVRPVDVAQHLATRSPQHKRRWGGGGRKATRALSDRKIFYSETHTIWVASWVRHWRARAVLEAIGFADADGAPRAQYALCCALHGATTRESGGRLAMAG